MKWQAISTVLRDLVSLALGAFIAISEELSGRVHPELLALAGALLAGPPAKALYHVVRGKGGKPQPPSTT